MIPEQGPSEGMIGTLLGRLTGLQDHLRTAARRSWRFSWFSWGFLFAVVVGTGLAALLVVLFPNVTTTVTLSGTTYTTAPSPWFYWAPMLPSVVLLALAVREVMLGRREARTGVPRIRPSDRQAGSPLGAGWTEVVQRSQQLVTNMRSETEIAFIPLALGGITLGSVLVGFLLLPNGTGSYPLAIATTIYVLPVFFLLLLIPFYWAVRGWTRDYQALLDRQVDSLARLEREFFTHFAGVAAGV